MSILLRHPLSQDMLCRRPGRFPVADKSRRSVDGIVFDSVREAKRYGELRLLERAKKIDRVLCQVPFDVMVKGKLLCRFTVDFAYRDLAKSVTIYEEVKSTGTAKDAAYRLRRKAAEQFHGIKITEHIA